MKCLSHILFCEGKPIDTSNADILQCLLQLHKTLIYAPPHPPLLLPLGPRRNSHALCVCVCCRHIKRIIPVLTPSTFIRPTSRNKPEFGGVIFLQEKGVRDQLNHSGTAISQRGFNTAAQFHARCEGLPAGSQSVIYQKLCGAKLAKTSKHSSGEGRGWALYLGHAKVVICKCRPFHRLD